MVAKVSNMSGESVKHEWRKCLLSVKGVGCSESMWRYVCIYYIMYARIVVDKKSGAHAEQSGCTPMHIKN